MELRENRTELERLLADVWAYDDGGHKKTNLPKWLFAFTLTGAILCTFSPSEIVAPVATAFAPAPEKLVVDNASSENVAEDIDYRVAKHTDSAAGWRAFLEAHPDGPHAQAARAAVDGVQPLPSPQPEQSRAPDDTAQQTAPPAPPPVVAEEEPPPAEPVAVAEQSPPPSAAEQAPIEAAQAPVEAAQPAAPVEAPVVIAEEEAPPPQALAAVLDAPLPPSRPRDIRAEKPAEPAHHSHSHADRREAVQPNVLTVLIAQLFRRHGQRPDSANAAR